MQKSLTRAFGKQCPLIACGLVVGDHTYDEFVNKPLVNAAEGDRIGVVFSITTNILHVDRCFKLAETTFEEAMQALSGE